MKQPDVSTNAGLAALITSLHATSLAQLFEHAANTEASFTRLQSAINAQIVEVDKRCQSAVNSIRTGCTVFGEEYRQNLQAADSRMERLESSVLRLEGVLADAKSSSALEPSPVSMNANDWDGNMDLTI